MTFFQRWIQRIRDWIDGPAHGGCVQTSRRSLRDSHHEARLRRLRDAWADGRTMTDADFDYWSDRYERLSIADTVGCSFNLYLNNPVLVESLRKDALNDRTLTPTDPSSDTTDRCLTKSRA